MTPGHIPVLREEVIRALDVAPGKRFIDATVGAGGHAVEILAHGGFVLGLDTDPTAIALTKETLGKERKDGWKVVVGNFKNIEAIATREKVTQVDGILFDLGVSSMQLDTPERGFSYRFTDAPLDLRMHQGEGESAAQLVNRASEKELYDIFSTYGEEQLAGDVARAFVRARSISPIVTVGDAVSAIEKAAGAAGRHDVLSRVFQGLRIAVNGELDALKDGLNGASHLLKQDGLLVVISFHSLEDRIVKQFFRTGDWEVLTKHPILPGEAECRANRRARSAKLRIGRKK